jgi:hypothetical protein
MFAVVLTITLPHREARLLMIGNQLRRMRSSCEWSLWSSEERRILAGIALALQTESAGIILPLGWSVQWHTFSCID